MQAKVERQIFDFECSLIAMNSTPDEEIGQRLQQVRERQDLNQAQAVRALRSAGLVWSQGTLSKVESGIRPIRLAELPAISKALGVSQSELLAPEDPISSALQRIRVVEQTAGEAFSDLRERYLSAAATRRSIQLLAELSEGLPGPYTVSCSSARFLSDALNDEYSRTALSADDALARLEIEWVSVGEIQIDSEEDLESLNATLPKDARLAMRWGDVKDLRNTSDERYNSNAYAGRLLTFHAMGKALEAKFPQVTFTDDEDAPRYFKSGLSITGIREIEGA